VEVNPIVQKPLELIAKKSGCVKDRGHNANLLLIEPLTEPVEKLEPLAGTCLKAETERALP
jgi:hypothetical protein